MAMTDKARFRHLMAVATLAVLLAGCGIQRGTPDDTIGSMLVSPGKFEFYNCAQLAAAAKPLAVREKELADLMAQAEVGGGAGNLISSIAYRPEYFQVHGTMNELRRAAAAKKCGVAPAREPPSASPGGKPGRQ